MGEFVEEDVSVGVPVESSVEPSLEDVLKCLSERGQLEWQLAYQQALIGLLRG